jgi:aminoglycoside phosphotransferase (APT) family kinase protein
MQVMIRSSGARIGWAELPDAVRVAVEAIIGDQVVEAVSQVGGFSPGTADRVCTTSGRRAFVKAVNPGLNERSAELHRREARVTASLPAGVPAPRLLGVHDDGDWVALVLEDIEGCRPVTPWQTQQLVAVLGALSTLAKHDLAPALTALPETGADLAEDLRGWQRIARDPPDGLDPWARAHLPTLVGLAERAPMVLTGNSLVHTDIRSDNLLVRPDGTVVVVDWPWATRGPAWFDTLAVLINVSLYGGHDVDALLSAHTPAGVDPDEQTAVLVGLAGYFLDAARLPAPAGLPTVRAFQAAEGAAVLAWIRQRLDTGTT